jgi:hypothetical protein
MANELGALHTLGFKPQTTPGSAESTVNTFLCTESISVNKNPKHIERKSHIGVGRLLPSRLGWFAPDGSATTEVMASQPHPWYWALGAVSSSRPAASTDPTVYLHTITVADTGPVNLTCEADRVFDHVKQADAKINKLKLAVKPGEVGTLEIEWLALDHTDGATLTSTPAFVTDVLTCRAVVIEVDDGVLATITDAEIEWDGMLKAPPTLQDGTGKPYVVRREAPPKVSGKLGFIDYPTAQLAKLTGATSFKLEVLLEGDTISNAYHKQLKITLPSCQYTGGLAPAIAAEVITGEADFEAYYDTVTSKQITVEAQNTIATINT